MIDSLLDSLGGLGLLGLCLLAAFLAFSETAIMMDLVVPGEVGLVIVGAATAEAGAAPVPVMAAAALGAVLGDSTSYAIGRTLGRPFIDRHDLTRRRLGPAVARGEAHFARHGGASVFVGRWIGALRAVVPFVAGVSRLRFPVFLAWNAAASLLWASAVVLVGHQVGRRAADVIDGLGLAVSIVAIAALVAWVVVQRRRRKRAIDPCEVDLRPC